jgi:phosphoenolpyruvate carboxylase
MNWPPTTMATQHPDNAGAPWWGSNPFISTQDEIEELITLFQELPIDEYMWDWEGKYVDEAVGEKLFSRASEFFTKHPLGEDLHLTYRIPAFDGEKMHRMARAFMNILALGDFARDIGLKHPPVTEMFLPLTVSADQPIQVRTAFQKVAGYHRSVFHHSPDEEREILQHFEVTPLVEDVDSLLSIEKIAGPFWESQLLERKERMKEHGQRIFLARSDPAMNAGLVPSVLAIKVALSTVQKLSESLGFPVYPVIGTGSLPFRGSVNPSYTETFLPQYAGVRTYSIQSAFRYDYEREEVERALKVMKEQAPTLKAVPVSDADTKNIRILSDAFSRIWRPTIESIAPLINAVAKFVPPRRERLQHIGLFGYSRGIGAVKLPRAIGFTAALYSIGVPPELIATGRGLREAQKSGLLQLIENFYPALRADVHHAGKYLNRENLELLRKKDPVFDGIKEDIDAIEQILGIQLGPEKPHHMIHRNLTSSIYYRMESGEEQEELRRDIVEAGVMRKSLG